ncbi:hypothetical protein [Cohnella cholangitidis]|uniref:Uncharacterized protein n=1 Tax=Cohnella cholangitidis TaxID=2598458 RepID=A0A7G5C328_9BACL|nr:hypothetical protein [Cohnella cholangitidis]QMV43612.1 hypothetical protein FPL14_22350 [Cohnella cholangitidis]
MRINRAYVLSVAILFIVLVSSVFVYKSNNSNIYKGVSENWRVSLTINNKDISTISCEYIGKRTDTINNFEYKLAGASNYFSGSEQGEWTSGYRYEKSNSNNNLTPNENNEFIITLTLDGETEKLILKK